jgi:hypothetical protein
MPSFNYGTNTVSSILELTLNDNETALGAQCPFKVVDATHIRPLKEKEEHKMNTSLRLLHWMQWILLCCLVRYYVHKPCTYICDSLF